jgi:nicotinamidase-related amidase
MERPQRRTSAPQPGRTALLLIDVINDLAFPEAEQLYKLALPMAKRLAHLKQRCRQKGIPAIYVNDNFGRWRSDFRAVVAHCLSDAARGREIVARLLPRDDDYFVLKPLHSGFYSTTLETLLTHLRADTLILTGIAADICVLFTANDAYMRGFDLAVPRDCVAANDRPTLRHALAQMNRLLKADVRASSRLRLSAQPPED